MTDLQSSAVVGKRHTDICLHRTIILMLSFAGIIPVLGSFAQDTLTPTYYNYETKAGTSTLTPPRHQIPPKDKKDNENGKTYKKLEKMPEFPGGTDAMNKFILTSLRYPAEARTKKIEGKVLVSFTVKDDGTLIYVETMNSIGGGCDEEAVRIVKSMPKWKPGENTGKPVDVSMVLPIVFRLASTDQKK